MIKLNIPYIPGYLAFRECPSLLKLLNECPSYFKPELVLVDGNGILHPLKFGLACQLGTILFTITTPLLGYVCVFLHSSSSLILSTILLRNEFRQ